MSGIELTAPYPGLKYYTVSQVRKDSPAYWAGIKVMGELVSINNTGATEYDLNEIYKIFQSKEGKKIKIVVNRNGERIKFTIELEKFI